MKKITNLKGSKGFTLIEIMIVLAVLAVMAAIVVPNVAGFLGRGKERAFEGDRRILQGAVDAWRTDIGARTGNPWPTVGGVKGTPADASDPVDGDYVDAGDTNSFIKLSLLTTGNVLKGNDTVKSYKYAATATLGDTGVASSGNVGSYLWYIDTNGLVQAYRWDDADADGKVDAGETTANFVTDVYP